MTQFNNNTLIVGKLIFHFLNKQMSPGQNKETPKLFYIPNQLDLRYLHSMPHNAKENIFYSSEHVRLSEIDPIMEQKTDVYKFKKLKYYCLTYLIPIQ